MLSQYLVVFNRTDRVCFKGTVEELIKCLEDNINLDNMYNIHVYVKEHNEPAMKYKFDDNFECLEPVIQLDKPIIETPTIHDKIKKLRMEYKIIINQQSFYCNSVQDLNKILEKETNVNNYKQIIVEHNQFHENENFKEVYQFNEQCTKLIKVNGDLQCIETPNINQKLFSKQNIIVQKEGCKFDSSIIPKSFMNPQYICVDFKAKNMQEMNYMILKDYLSKKTYNEVKNILVYDFHWKVTYKFSDKTHRFESITGHYLSCDLTAHLMANYKIAILIHDFDTSNNLFMLSIKEICHKTMQTNQNEQQELENYRLSIINDKSFEKNFTPFIENSYIAGLYFIKNDKVIGTIKDGMIIYKNTPYKKINNELFETALEEIEMYWESVNDLDTFSDEIQALFMEKINNNKFVKINDSIINGVLKNPVLMVKIMLQINDMEIYSHYC